MADGKKKKSTLLTLVPRTSKGRPEGTPKKSETYDLEKIRDERTVQNRRQAERFFLSELMQVFAVTGEEVLTPIEVVNVSEGGCAIKMPVRFPDEPPTVGGSLKFRLYLSPNAYLNLGLKVRNCSTLIEGGKKYYRVGCSMDESFQAVDAYRHFVRFLDSVARTATRVSLKAGSF